jgi:hypothetical protein
VYLISNPGQRDLSQKLHIIAVFVGILHGQPGFFKQIHKEGLLLVILCTIHSRLAEGGGFLSVIDYINIALHLS